ncbi:MAG: nodulation protein NfeD [Candidatus Methanomethylicia archaeon]
MFVHKYRHIISIFFMISYLSLLIFSNSIYASMYRVYYIEVDAAIDAGTAEYIINALSKAEAANSPLIVRLNTYGGYMDSMDNIINAFMSSKVDVVVWVGPPGAKAVSAGTFIALAANYLVMSEGSVIGSCQPRSTTGEPVDPKVLNYAIERMRAIAERKYGVNDSRVDIAVKFVTENLDLTVGKALELKIADFKANTFHEVLSIFGWVDYEVVRVERSIASQLYSLLNDPLIVGLLFELGFWLILIELFTAGIQLYGFVGAAMIVLSLFGMGLIGPSATALAMLIIGSLLILVELYFPGIQLFGFLGLVMYALGILFMYREQPYIEIGVPQYAIVSMIAIMGGLFIVYVNNVRKSWRRARGLLDPKKLIGMSGFAKTDIKAGGTGVVHVFGEEWTAFSDVDIRSGQKVKVIDVVGLRLKVIPE